MFITVLPAGGDSPCLLNIYSIHTVGVNGDGLTVIQWGNGPDGPIEMGVLEKFVEVSRMIRLAKQGEAVVH